MLIILALAFAATAPSSVRPPIISSGCEGELCYETGHWIATRDLPIFDRVNGSKRLGTIHKGTAVTALQSLIVTTRVGLGRMLRSGDYLHQYGSHGPPVHLRKGELVYLLHYEGEGLHAAMTRGGKRLSISRDAAAGGQVDFQLLRPYATTDWVKLRLPDGRTGWSRPSKAFRCSSHMDDVAGQCRSKFGGK